MQDLEIYVRDLDPARLAIWLEANLDQLLVPLTPFGNKPGLYKAEGRYADDLVRISVYADAFGNAWTGLRDMAPNATLMAGGLSFAPARTFGDRPPGHALWYTNSNGFIELAVNQGSAMQAAGLNLGDPVQVRMP